MKILFTVLDGFTWRHRAIGCIRHGHALICTSNDGHLCVRCGRHWA
jgi:hypothetical protein